MGVQEEPLDRDLVLQLLSGLMEAEEGRAKASMEAWSSRIDAVTRARQQAQRLDAEELARLRAKEARHRTSPEDIQRLWEHAEWNENHFREQEDKLDEMRERIEDLEAENAALKSRLSR